MIQRRSLGEYNFEKYKKMRIKDGERKEIEKDVQKRGANRKLKSIKVYNSKEECVLPCSLPSLSN